VQARNERRGCWRSGDDRAVLRDVVRKCSRNTEQSTESALQFRAGSILVGVAELAINCEAKRR
jgi:hypothetical protein